MDVMTILQGPAFSRMSDNFKRREQELGHGLPLHDFIEIMLESLPTPNDANEKRRMISGLINLFEDIDINGDASLEFEEFTAYCIDTGLIATKTCEVTKTKYVEKKSYVDKTTTNDHIHSLYWFEPLNKLFAIEYQSQSIKVYTKDCELIQEIHCDLIRSYEYSSKNKESVTAAAGSSTSTKSGTEIEGVVLDIEYIPDLKELVSCGSDFTIAFWDVTKNFSFCNVLYCQSAQSICRWMSVSKRLFTSGNDGVIYIWKIESDQRVLFRTIIQHTDVVMDMLQICNHEIIATGSLDHKILLWDLHDARYRGKLIGHTRGIQKLLYSKKKDLFFSIGFEYAAFVWDLSSYQIILKLEGHRASLVSIQLINFDGIQRAVTGDCDGIFKVWNVDAVFTAAGQVVETFSSNGGISKFIPRTFVALTPGTDIVAAGSVMHIFKSIRLTNDDTTPRFAFYNRMSNQFIGVNNSSSVVWNGKNGMILNEFKAISSSDIVKCCLDQQKRKLFLINEDGYIVVLNSTTFVQLKISQENIFLPVCLCYNTMDKCILIMTRDGGIYIYNEDDDEDEMKCSCLRSLQNAHTHDIIEASFSHQLSLMATSGTELLIKCWDFETLELVTTMKGFTNEMNLLHFLYSLSVLISVDGKGNIFFWYTRPHPLHGQCFHVFNPIHELKAKNILSGKGKDVNLDNIIVENKSTVHVIQSAYDPIQDIYLLFIGDDSGRISTWNLSNMLRRCHLDTLNENDLLWKKKTYNPYRRFIRQGRGLLDQQANACGGNKIAPQFINTNFNPKENINHSSFLSTAPKSKKNTRERKLSQKITMEELKRRNNLNTMDVDINSHVSCREPRDIDLITTWIAHYDCINNIDLNEKPNLCITTSYSNIVKVWDWKGNLLGQLGGPEKSISWRFNINGEDDETNIKQEEKVTQIIHELNQRVNGDYSMNQSYHMSDNGFNNPVLIDLLRPKTTQRISTLQDYFNNTSIKLPPHDDNFNHRRTDCLSQLSSRNGKRPQNDYELEARNNCIISSSADILTLSPCGKENIEIIQDDEDDGRNNIQIPGHRSKKAPLTLKEKQKYLEKNKKLYEHYSQMVEKKKNTMKHSIDRKADITPSAFLLSQIPDIELISLQALQQRTKTAACVTSSLRQQLHNNRDSKTCPSIRQSLNDQERKNLQSAQSTKQDQLPAFITQALLSATSTRPSLLIHSKNNQTFQQECEKEKEEEEDDVFYPPDLPGLTTSPSCNSIWSSVSQVNQKPLHSSSSTGELSRRQSVLQSKKSLPILSVNKPSSIERINGIINSADTGSTSTSSLSSVVENEKDVDKKTKMALEIKERIYARNLRYQEILNAPDSGTLEEAKQEMERIRKQKAQVRDKKAKRAKKYLEQKQKALHSNLGHILRQTSVAYHGEKNEKKSEKRFGMYSLKEVMSVIRLFWSLDYTQSGHILMEELAESEMFLDIFGHGNMDAVFQELDLDASGDVSLKEILIVCFTYASPAQIQDMLNIAKIGRIEACIKTAEPLTEEQRAELRSIFNMYDKDKSGTISPDELFEAMQATEDDETIGLTKKDVDKFYKLHDVDGNQELDIDEFIDLLKDTYTS